MRTVLPGKAQATLQAVTSSQWRKKRLIAYISGNSIVVLDGPQSLLQTIVHDECDRLEAVSIDGITGKIAACSEDEVLIYSPYGYDEGLLQWSLQSSIAKEEGDTHLCTLSWGSDGELLAGSSSLTLYQTNRDGHRIWRSVLPRPVKLASFSTDASLIATCGWHDRLVKVWRRQAFGSDETRFDFSYLSHPSAVTAIHWRVPPPHRHHNHERTVDDVLYTIALDGKVRIWAATDVHAVQSLQFWAEIDMLQSIQPRCLDPDAVSDERYAFFIESHDFQRSAEIAINIAQRNTDPADHAIEHVREIMRNQPDFCVVLDQRGNMSAWGLENVGCKARKVTDIFNVAHIEDFPCPSLENTLPFEKQTTFLTFVDATHVSPFNLLIHHFDGRVIWLQGDIATLLDPKPNRRRLSEAALWTGHDALINRVMQEGSGELLSCITRDNYATIWRASIHGARTSLIQQSIIINKQAIRELCMFDRTHAVVVASDTISLWDSRLAISQQLAMCTIRAKVQHDSKVAVIPHAQDNSKRYAIVIDRSMNIAIFGIDLPVANPAVLSQKNTTMSHLNTFALADARSMFLMTFVVLPPTTPESSCAVADYVLFLSSTVLGEVEIWRISGRNPIASRKLEPLKSVKTGIAEPAMICGTKDYRIALVDFSKTRLMIWDLYAGVLEYDDRQEPAETVQTLSWSTLSCGYSLLAVGSAHKVRILAQMPLDNNAANSGWSMIRAISTRDLSPHPMTGCVWLKDDVLVLAAGHQFFVHTEYFMLRGDRTAEEDTPTNTKAIRLSELMPMRNCAVHAYDPRVLENLVYNGQSWYFDQVALALREALKYYVSGDDMDLTLGLSFANFDGFSTASQEQYMNGQEAIQANPPDFADNVANICDHLLDTRLPDLSEAEQERSLAVFKSMASIDKQRRSVDSNGQRFYLSLTMSTFVGSHTCSMPDIYAWRSTLWASRSTSQEILIDQMNRRYHGKIQWEDARDCGMFMWINDIESLRSQFENVARNEYTKTDEKSPVNCSLYYLALRKKSVLVGLWRVATGNREQAGTQKLLKNDFSDPRWKTAALKNAYALLGKRRFEYAAAWFLLAGNLQDAVNVCVQQLDDLQLGVAVARVYEGDQSAVLRKLLFEKALPHAALQGNRWLASWAYWLVGLRDMALRALVEPLGILIGSSNPMTHVGKSYLTQDPSLMSTYQDMRDEVLADPKYCSAVSSTAEWHMILRTARHYTRMGCHVFALDLLRTWKFVAAPSRKVEANHASKGAEPEESEESDSSSISTSQSVDERDGQKKPAPTIFKEPEANSLLDSFGF